MDLKERELNIGDVVAHFKQGRLYKILALARHSETGESLVIYQALYPPFGTFARPEEMFCSEVDHDKYPESGYRYRMTRVEICMRTMHWNVGNGIEHIIDFNRGKIE